MPTIPTFRAVVESPAYNLRNLVVAAGIISVSVFLLNYVVALRAGFSDEYLGSFSMNLILISIFGGLVVLLWTAKYHLRVWDDVRRCFEVSDQTYHETVDPLLKRAYSVKRIVVEFLFALVLVVIWNVVLRNPIPYAVWFDGYKRFANCLVSSQSMLCVDALSVINYLYGFVGLFVVIAGTHGVAHFLILASRVTDFPLNDVDTAAERLEPLARFSIFVATITLVGIITMLVVYARLLTIPESDAMELALFVAQYAFFILVVLAGFIIIGLLVFWIPQMAIHNALTEAKQDRLAAINDEYVDLLERCRSEAAPPDHLATELEIIEARRHNAKEIKTWSYNLPTLLPFFGSALASVITWLQGVMKTLPVFT